MTLVTSANGTVAPPIESRTPSGSVSTPSTVPLPPRLTSTGLPSAATAATSTE